LLVPFLSGFGFHASHAAETGIQERQAELRRLQAQVEERRLKIVELRKEGESLETLLAEHERQRSMTERYIRTLKVQMDAIENDMAARRAQLGRQEAELRATRQGLSQALVHYYKHGRVQAAELLISSCSFGEIFARSHYWVRAIRKLRSRVLDALEQGERIRQEVEVIQSRRRVVLDLQQERQRQLREVINEQEARRRDRNELECTVAQYEEQTRKLLASQKKIEQMIAEAQRASPGTAGLGLESLRGRLPWPVSGRITTGFGTHVHPKYGTRVTQKGIEIAAAEGTPIKAVAGGRVVFDGWFEGYGKTVILDHGKGYFTLYAHASKIPVTRGERVMADQVIAFVGSTDSLKGSCLHFEIRRGKGALDPVRWLSKRR
ncbi:MAG: peptidoglycan DD-metalloendopeptidase family protein, partial [Candidatus Eisenbacteria sp.]|nr:peptidoglycan DD-metalloendopeptidase family protein [Candidatus Eisenbacteria bacterium]